jgi:hypothetical protein
VRDAAIAHRLELPDYRDVQTPYAPLRFPLASPCLPASQDRRRPISGQLRGPPRRHRLVRRLGPPPVAVPVKDPKTRRPESGAHDGSSRSKPGDACPAPSAFATHTALSKSDTVTGYRATMQAQAPVAIIASSACDACRDNPSISCLKRDLAPSGDRQLRRSGDGLPVGSDLDVAEGPSKPFPSVARYRSRLQVTPT